MLIFQYLVEVEVQDPYFRNNPIELHTGGKIMIKT